jgi:hypothetical protein
MMEFGTQAQRNIFYLVRTKVARNMFSGNHLSFKMIFG